jgi:hypothetical protein
MKTPAPIAARIARWLAAQDAVVTAHAGTVA